MKQAGTSTIHVGTSMQQVGVSMEHFLGALLGVAAIYFS
jgi:hypothetical protein